MRQSIPAIRSSSLEIQHTNAYNTKYHEWSWRVLKMLSGSVLEEGTPACWWGMKRHNCAQSCSQNICIFLGWAGNSSWSWFSAGKRADWSVVLCQWVRLRFTSHFLCELPRCCPHQATWAWQTWVSLVTALGCPQRLKIQRQRAASGCRHFWQRQLEKAHGREKYFSQERSNS